MMAAGMKLSQLSRRLGIHTLVHDRNRGYGANQKTCYAAALARGADIVVMLHPDYQYSPKLVTAMASMIASGHYDVVLGSRILGRGALAGGMPLYKYIANRFLTLFENSCSGLSSRNIIPAIAPGRARCWSAWLWRAAPMILCSITRCWRRPRSQVFAIGEISCPTRYFAEASSINFRRSVTYGLGVLRTALAFRLARWKLRPSALFGDAA